MIQFPNVPRAADSTPHDQIDWIYIINSAHHVLNGAPAPSNVEGEFELTRLIHYLGFRLDKDLLANSGHGDLKKFFYQPNWLDRMATLEEQVSPSVPFSVIASRADLLWMYPPLIAQYRDQYAESTHARTLRQFYLIRLSSNN